jgi:hypothetical protein
MRTHRNVLAGSRIGILGDADSHLIHPVDLKTDPIMYKYLCGLHAHFFSHAKSHTR